MKSNLPVVSMVSVKESLPVSIRFIKQAERFKFSSLESKYGFSLYEKSFFESFKHLFKEMAPKRWSLCRDFIAFLYVYESSR